MTRPRERRRPEGTSPIALTAKIEPIQTAAVIDAANSRAHLPRVATGSRQTGAEAPEATPTVVDEDPKVVTHPCISPIRSS